MMMLQQGQAQGQLQQGKQQQGGGCSVSPNIVMEYARNAIRHSHFSNSLLFFVLCTFSLWWLLFNFSNLELSFQTTHAAVDVTDHPVAHELPLAIIVTTAADAHPSPRHTSTTAAVPSVHAHALKDDRHSTLTSSAVRVNGDNADDGHRSLTSDTPNHHHANNATAAAADSHHMIHGKTENRTVVINHVEVVNTNSSQYNAEAAVKDDKPTIIRPATITYNRSSMNHSAVANASVGRRHDSHSRGNSSSTVQLHDRHGLASKDNNNYTADGSTTEGDLKLATGQLHISPSTDSNEKQLIEPISALNRSTTITTDNTSAATAAAFCADSRYWEERRECDLSRGEWVWDPTAEPLYSSDSCGHVHGNQECVKNGRPDREYERWRWQPSCGGSLPRFDPALFLRLMAGRSMLFAGDSLARNHMESLLCSLSTVEKPTYDDRLWEHTDLFNFTFPTYNFTLGSVWVPFLVNDEQPRGEGQLPGLHVDWAHPRWTTVLPHYDVAIFSGAYWLFRQSVYYVDGRNVSVVDPAEPWLPETVASMKLVWKTVLKHLVEDSGFNGTAIMRTVSVSHFDENSWDKGGTCNKTRPTFVAGGSAEEAKYEWQHDVVYKLQREAFEAAQAEVERRRSRGESPPTLRLMDVTYSTWLRPDGHPSRYRIQKTVDHRNDCLHWCLPGVVDTWNQFLMADPHIVCGGRSP